MQASVEFGGYRSLEIQGSIFIYLCLVVAFCGGWGWVRVPMCVHLTQH